MCTTVLHVRAVPCPCVRVCARACVRVMHRALAAIQRQNTVSALSIKKLNAQPRWRFLAPTARCGLITTLCVQLHNEYVAFDDCACYPEFALTVDFN